MGCRARGRGFTLTEVLITIVIIGILAAMAVPQYRKTMERSWWRHAQDMLMTIYAGEQVYFSANDFYYPNVGSLAACGGVPACMASWRNNIYTDDPNLASIPVTFGVTGGGALSAKATLNDGSGRNMTVDQDRTLDTSGWPMP